MTDTETANAAPELQLTTADIHRAADEGVLSHEDAERLVRWGYEHRFDRLVMAEPKPRSPEAGKGFNLVTIAYYFGAMLMISAGAWFLGDKWEALGSRGIFITAEQDVIAFICAGWVLEYWDV